MPFVVWINVCSQQLFFDQWNNLEIIIFSLHLKREVKPSVTTYITYLLNNKQKPLFCCLFLIMERRQFFLPQSKYSFLPFLFLFAEDLSPLGSCHSVKTDIGFKEVLLPEPTGFLGPLWHRAPRSKACLEERFQELEEMYPPWRLGTKKQERTLNETSNAYPCWCVSCAQVKQDICEQATPKHKASAESTPLGTQSQAPMVSKRQSPPFLSPAWLPCSLFSVYAWQSKGKEKPCWAWGPMEPEEEDSLNSVFQPC